MRFPVPVAAWLSAGLILVSTVWPGSTQAASSLEALRAALTPPPAGSNVTAAMGAATSTVAPGQSVWVGLRLKMNPGWHTYWTNPGTAGIATKIDWQLPAGWTAGPIQWPAPKTIPIDGPYLSYGYEGEVLLPVQLTAAANTPPGPVKISARAAWLECSADKCVDGGADLQFSLSVATGTPVPNPPWNAAIEATLASLPQAPAMFNVSAWRQGDFLFIGLEPNPGGAVNSNPTGVYFFSADSQAEPAGTQTLTHSGAGWVLKMKSSTSSPPPVTALRGVLATSGSWTTNGQIPALALNPPLAAQPPAAFAGALADAPTDLSFTGLSLVLVFGFLGGLILNVMPCVFPVLGIKVLGFVQQAGEARRHVILHGVIFTAGVLVSMWTLVGVLQSLRAAGAELGWGFQLQEPGFVLGLTIFFLVFALSLSGVFELGLAAIGVGSNLTARSGLAGSFFQGVLAVVVATPCTAPLLAPALGAAFTLPAVQGFLAFTAIALGLASPYLTLSLFPGMVRALPRPGAWMETFKQFMAFPLYATAGFLLYVLAGQISPERFLNVLLALVVVAMAAWLYGRFATPGVSVGRRRFGQVGTVLLLLGGLALAYWPEQKLDWQPWSPDLVAKLQKEDRPVYVDFTARWCATCQSNERLVFSSQQVLDAFKQQKVALLKGDWTNRDPAITAELLHYGAAAVPLNLLYLPGQTEPVVLPSLLTPSIVLNALQPTAAKKP